VTTSGTAVPAFKSVKTAGHMVNGQALYTVNVLDEATVDRERKAMMLDSMATLRTKRLMLLSVGRRTLDHG
jgi:hypothetical protein